MTGITLSSTAAMMLLGIMEGVALRLRVILKSLVAHGLASPPDPSCCVVGSGLALERNVAWRQLLADILEYPVVMLRCGAEQATLRGGARLVLEAVTGSSGESTSFADAAHSMSAADCAVAYGLSSDDIASIYYPRVGLRAYYEAREQLQVDTYNNILSNVRV